MSSGKPLTDDDYAALADFRHTLRQFLAFSEGRAAECGLTPQQHQALLAIRGAAGEPVSIGYVAERLVLKPHSTTGLIDRLETAGLVTRQPSPTDRRQAMLHLTPKAETLLQSLSESHRDEIVRVGPLLKDLLDRLL